MSVYEGKYVWITGASSGIGEALALEYARLKAYLIISARRIDELTRVQKECLKFTNNCEILPFDLADNNSVVKAADEYTSRFQKCHILINNGGISQRSFAAETVAEVDRRIMEINYFSYITITKKVIPLMQAEGFGHIVVISSISGKFGFPLRSAYSASKHALHGFFDTLRFELYDKEINVTIVCPGRIKTNISYHALGNAGNEHGKMDKGQANGIPADICARKIISAVNRNKKEIYIAQKEYILLLIRRFIPSLFRTIVLKLKPE